MKILSYSSIKTQWQRIGTNIQYIKTLNGPFPKRREYYTLSFTHKFEFDKDIVEFAYSYPYTYSDLVKYISSPPCSIYAHKENLCKTISGYDCDYLIITANNDNESKRGVIFTARVHPGETIGSWMIHGAIDFLVSNDSVAQRLRENFIFMIVPMLNPDGVIQGNYRTSLMGCDLNRRYVGTMKVFHSLILGATSNNSWC